MPTLSIPQAIFFDLDGTLADTAPDLADAINQVRVRRGLPPAPYEKLRPVASAGARGLIGAAFDLAPGQDGYEDLRVEFLDTYASALAVQSTLFEGIPASLARLEEIGLPWGIVTNKASRFSEPLVSLIGLQHAHCLVSGDTTPHSKPHPAPLLEAANRLEVEAKQCWYVGDDLRDIQAGKAAGMITVAAGWGYCGDIEPATWGADVLLRQPEELLQLLPA